MPQQPQVYLIHANDARQHQGRLQEILQQLQAEQRITSFHTLRPDAVTELEDQVQHHDLVLILLTNELEASRNHLEQVVQALRVELPQIKLAEVIVDNLPYNSEFITFPSDLHPIRSRQDSDTVWQDIEQQLRNMLPAQKERLPKSTSFPFTSFGIKINMVFLITVVIALLTPIYAHHDLYGFALIAVLIIHIIGLIIGFRSAQASIMIKIIFIFTLLIAFWGLFTTDRDEDFVFPLWVISGINFIGLFFRKQKKGNKS